MMSNIFRGILIISLYAMIGCQAKGDKIIPVYNNYRFDQAVIEKIPIYDSLASAISGKILLFQKSVNENDSYQAFRYMPGSVEKEIFKKLPANIDINIDQYFTKLGNDFIYGFDVFKDSSIKIYVRRKTIEPTKVEIEENLSYYPRGNAKNPREYPIKDTIINAHWQYWTRFDTDDIF